MARLPRLTLGALPHYVVQAAVHGQPLAPADEDRRALLQALQAAADAQQITLWAYAVLERELHLLLLPPDSQALGRAMQRLGRHYVPAFNRRHGRQGALWAGRYRAAVLQPGDWVLAALRRIDGLARAQGAWSSTAHHLGLARDPLLAEPPELWALGNTPFDRESAYRALLDQGLPPEREAELARAVHGAWVLGGSDFVASAAARSGRPAVPRSPGRPRRVA